MSRCRIVIAVLATAILAGCGALGAFSNPQSITWFSLDDLDLTSAPGLKPAAGGRNAKPRILIIGQVDSNPFYNNTQIAYSRSDIARAYYQFAAWTERPAKRISVLIEQRLARTRGIASVASRTAGVIGELELNLSLDALYHDAAGSPQAGRITLRADLIDRSQRKIIARRTFDAAAPVPIADAANAVRAMSEATSKVLGQLTGWVITHADGKAANTHMSKR